MTTNMKTMMENYYGNHDVNQDGKLWWKLHENWDGKLTWKLLWKTMMENYDRNKDANYDDN